MGMIQIFWSDPRCKFTWREASHKRPSHFFVSGSSRVARSITPARSSICVSEAIISSFHHLAHQRAPTFEIGGIGCCAWCMDLRQDLLLSFPTTRCISVHICDSLLEHVISYKCCDVLESKLFPYEESRESCMLYIDDPIISCLVLDSQ